MKSRTNKDETPADLAKANSKKDIAEFLDNWDWPNCTAREEDWLCTKDIDRKEAIELLSKHPEDGTFLVRQSRKRKNLHVLSTIYQKTCCHFVIEARGVYFFLEDGPYMPSLEHLIDHYSRFADGLPFKLCHPLFKVLKAKDPTYALGKFILIEKLLVDEICNSLFISYLFCDNVLGLYFGMIF